MGITLPKTKIVCTIGPASDTPQTIRELISSGMRIARLIQNPNDIDDVIEIVAKLSIDAGDLSEGDLAIITAGQPVWVADMTNMIRVKRMALTT